MSDKSPLQKARETSETLTRFGIRKTDHHIHVGENGTRCEFCQEPVQAAIHDPERLGRGTAPPAAKPGEPQLRESVKAFCEHVTEQGDLRKSAPFEEPDGGDHLANWVGGCSKCIDLFNAMEKSLTVATPASQEDRERADRKQLVSEVQQIFSGVRSKCLDWKDLETFLPLKIVDWAEELQQSTHAAAIRAAADLVQSYCLKCADPDILFQLEGEIRALSPSPAKPSKWVQDPNCCLHLEGKHCIMHMTDRPHYCDRGSILVHLRTKPGNELTLFIDAADCWPRYYMDKERGKLECEDWMKKRGEWIEGSHAGGPQSSAVIPPEPVSSERKAD